MTTVLIVSHLLDEHAIRVSDRLISNGHCAQILDASKIPSETAVTIKYSTQDEVIICLDGETIYSKDIIGVWWRRPAGSPLLEARQGIAHYIFGETEVIVRSLEYFLDSANWISNPECTRLAGRKPVQLHLAQKIGLRIPYTCITSSEAEALYFIDSLGDRDLTMKPVGTSLIRLSNENWDNEQNQVVFTKIADKSQVVAYSNLVGNCPVIFQEAIIKDYDVRVTVVDEQAFAACIRISGCADPTNLDWRNYEGTRSYEPHILPANIAAMCIELTARLGLRFGCLDFGYSESNGYTFFEINPQGQWLPSEDRAGYDISGALAAALVRERS